MILQISTHKTDPLLGKHIGEQDYFDKGLPALLENEKHNVHTTVHQNFDSPASFHFIRYNRTAINHTTSSSSPALSTITEGRSSSDSTTKTNFNTPDFLTARILDSSEDSDECVEPTQPLRRSQRLQQQNQNKYHVFETAGTQLLKTQPSKHTSQGKTKEAPNFVDLLNNRHKERQQIQFVQRTGSQQSGSNTKKHRPNMNEIQQDTTKNIKIVKEDIFRKTCNVGHCVSSDFHIRAGIAAKFNQLYTKIKRKASKKLIPGSVFEHYDKYSRLWIYNLVKKFNFFHKPFYETLRTSLLLMRNQAERNIIKHTCLPKLGSGLDNLQWQVVQKILRDVSQSSTVKIPVCFRL